ncbi:hypothetical protein J6590_046626 [Homalodisca vitripennis]|nr:hypothetical protein J6590_046626 [Homalodisca vitripennis]
MSTKRVDFVYARTLWNIAQSGPDTFTMVEVGAITHWETTKLSLGASRANQRHSRKLSEVWRSPATFAALSKVHAFVPKIASFAQKPLTEFLFHATHANRYLNNESHRRDLFSTYFYFRYLPPLRLRPTRIQSSSHVSGLTSLEIRITPIKKLTIPSPVSQTYLGEGDRRTDNSPTQ